MTHHTLDASRLLCPMPVIRTQQKVETLQGGDTLEVTCTDPGTKNDIPAWCRINGHKLLKLEERNNSFVFTVEVGCHGD